LHLGGRAYDPNGVLSSGRKNRHFVVETGSRFRIQDSGARSQESEIGEQRTGAPQAYPSPRTFPATLYLIAFSKYFLFGHFYSLVSES
jgi:hypothetical protein